MQSLDKMKKIKSGKTKKMYEYLPFSFVNISHRINYL